MAHQSPRGHVNGCPLHPGSQKASNGHLRACERKLKRVGPERKMATKGNIRVLGRTPNGAWIVAPVCSASIDSLMSAYQAGVLLEVRLKEPVTRSGKRKHQLPNLRLVGADEGEGH